MLAACLAAGVSITAGAFTSAWAAPLEREQANERGLMTEPPDQATAQPLPEAFGPADACAPLSASQQDSQTEETGRQAQAADSQVNETAAGSRLSAEQGTEGESQKDATPEKPKSAGLLPTEATLDPTYFYQRALSLVKEQRYQDALNYINKALELNPRYFEAWYEKGLIYQLSGYDAAAARRYKALLERKPDMVEAHVSLGTLYRKHKNLSLAAAEYKAAVDLNYYSFAAHYNLANLLMDQKLMEEALKEYKICLRLKPDEAVVHNNIGVIYQQKNYLEEAADEYLKASHLDPARPAYVENLTLVRNRLSKKPSRHVSM